MRCRDAKRDGEMCSLRCPACSAPVPVPFLLEQKLGQDKDVVAESCPSCHASISVETIRDFLDVQTFSRDQLKLMKHVNCEFILNVFETLKLFITEACLELQASS